MRLLLPIILVVAMASCKKEATRWQSDWLLPVLHDTLSLKNLYNDSTLTINNGQIDVDLTRNILNLGLSDLIQIPDTSIVQTYQSNFTVNNVSPGFMFVNSVKTHDLELADIQLKKVRVQSGQIQLKVYNPLNTAVLYQIELPGVSSNGQVFVQNYTVAAGTVQNPTVSTETIDLSGYDIDLSGTQGLEFNKLQSKLTLKTDPNGATVSIYNNQVFKFEAAFKNLRFDYAKGYFGSAIISGIEQFTLPYLDLISAGNLTLPDLQMDLTIENGFKMALRAQIEQLSATNSQGQTIALSAPSIGPSMFISPAVGSWNTLQPSSLNLHFDQNNSNIKNYLEHLGAQQQISYQIQPNPWGNTSAGHDEAFAHSRLKVKVAAQMPLSLTADGLTLQDTFAIDLAQDLNKSHVSAATLILDATNAFPLACDLIIYFMKDGQIWHTVVADAQLASALLGQVDPLDGLQKKKSKIKIVLPPEVVADLQDLNQVLVSATFATTDPNTGVPSAQSVQANAFLALQMKIQLQTQIKP
ncbi:MAG: hypothetical protein ACKOWM_00395 [Sphingomonadales bacterium]|jgi:hypothetical protein